MIKVLFDLFTSFCQTKITIDVPDKKMTYGSDKVTQLMPEYESCHGFLNMLDISKDWLPEIRYAWHNASLKVSRLNRLPCEWYLVPRYWPPLWDD